MNIYVKIQCNFSTNAVCAASLTRNSAVFKKGLPMLNLENCLGFSISF